MGIFLSDTKESLGLENAVIANLGLIFADAISGTINLGSAVTGTDRLNVFGGGTGTQTGIASFYDSSSNIKFRMRDEWTASSIPPRLESHSSLGFAFNITTNSKYIWYINGTGNEKMRLTSDGLGIGTPTPDALVDIETVIAGITTSMRIHNAEGTNGSSHARLELRTETAFGGDPHILFTVGGQGNWVMGTDNGDTDAFKISKSTVLGTNTRLKIDFKGSVDCASIEGALIVNRLTTTQRDAINPISNGMVIYNTTTSQFNFRESGAWVTK